MSNALTMTGSGASLSQRNMPGHWVLARLGKSVLRPGGMELTRRMLAALTIMSTDDVVEFAPGLRINCTTCTEASSGFIYGGRARPGGGCDSEQLFKRVNAKMREGKRRSDRPAQRGCHCGLRGGDAHNANTSNEAPDRP